MFVMLLISVVTQIPQLNLAKLFSLESDPSSDPERQLLADSVNNSTSYMRQVDEDEPSILASSSSQQQLTTGNEESDIKQNPKY